MTGGSTPLVGCIDNSGEDDVREALKGKGALHNDKAKKINIMI